MTTLNATLSLNGKTIELTNTQLIDIINELNDSRLNEDFLEEAAKTNHYLLHKAIAAKDYLSEDTINRLAASNEPRVLKTLLGSIAAQTHLSTTQVIRIAMLSPYLACAVIDNLDELSNISNKTVLRALANHEDAAVRLALVESGNAPQDVIAALRFDDDDEVSEAASLYFDEPEPDDDDESDEEEDDWN